MLVLSSNCIFTLLITTQVLVYPCPSRIMVPGSQTVFTPNSTFHHINELVIQVLLDFNHHPHSHTLDFVVTELLELFKFKLCHQPHLCSAVPSL